MRKYLRRELCLLELDDAEYFQYTPSVPDFRYMSIILEQEYEFNYLSKSPVQPMYNLYAASKDEKLRAFLACFDAEVLLYFDSKLDQKTPCLIIFLCCVRYLAKQIKLKDWEGKKYNHLALLPNSNLKQRSVVTFPTDLPERKILFEVP